MMSSVSQLNVPETPEFEERKPTKGIDFSRDTWVRLLARDVDVPFETLDKVLRTQEKGDELTEQERQQLRQLDRDEMPEKEAKALLQKTRYYCSATITFPL